jgi:hypothetical protein
MKICWEGMGGEENFTAVGEQEGRCERVLEMMRRRGLRDVLRVYFEPK